MGSLDHPGEQTDPADGSRDRPSGPDRRSRGETEAEAAERLGLSNLARGDYYDSQRAAAEAQEAAIKRRDAARDQTVDHPEQRLEEPRSYWTEVPRFLSMWQRIADRWPGRRAPDEKPPLPEPEAIRIDAQAKEVVEAEPSISDNVARVARDSSQRSWLGGFEFRIKGIDRIREKAAEKLEVEPDRTPEEAVREVSDAIRYTFCLDGQDYSSGYGEIKDKLETCGYRIVYCKNWWSNDEYKGVNTRWVTAEGQRFEVQFHTAESFHAKHEVTHQAYERLRGPTTSDRERIELREFQREVSSWIPVPGGVSGILDHKKEDS